MIQIAVDEKACVSCGLCADVCPTQVLSFNAERDLPEVKEPRECFGCLSCSEICPATALDHPGARRSESYYQDPYALHLGARLTGNGGLSGNTPGDEESRRRALDDLGVRLRSVSWVLKDIMGNGLPVVGMLAGRTLANQLPRYQPPKDLDAALELARQEFAPAWELAPRRDGETLTLDVAGCFVRDLCHKEKLELGGEMCVLFLNYLSGYLGRMGKVRLKLADAQRGPQRCTYRLTVQG